MQKIFSLKIKNLLNFNLFYKRIHKEHLKIYIMYYFELHSIICARVTYIKLKVERIVNIKLSMYIDKSVDRLRLDQIF